MTLECFTTETDVKNDMYNKITESTSVLNNTKKQGEQHLT